MGHIIYFAKNNPVAAAMIVATILNIIALCAIVFARSEIKRALREIDKASSALASARESAAAFSAKSLSVNSASTNGRNSPKLPSL